MRPATGELSERWWRKCRVRDQQHLKDVLTQDVWEIPTLRHSEAMIVIRSPQPLDAAGLRTRRRLMESHATLCSQVVAKRGRLQRENAVLAVPRELGCDSEYSDDPSQLVRCS